MRRKIPGLVCALGLVAPALAHAWAPPNDDSPASGGEAEAEAEAEGGGESSGAMSLSGGASLGGGAEADTAADTEADASAAGEAETETDAQPRKWNPRKHQPWIKRWAPEPHMVELGIYGGLFLLNRDHELFDPDVTLPQQGWMPLRGPNPDFGLRAGYYPLRFFGIEAEGGAMPSRLDAGGGVTPFTVRGHAVGQLGLWSVTPFVLVGAGMLGINSSGPLGTDIDPAMHFGGGAKVYINRWLMLRLDVRDVVSHKRGVDNTFISHNLEVLLGLSVTLNRKNRPQGQPAPEATPAGPGDRDGDGILDTDDACIDEPETQNGYQDDDGCPESDRDGDSYWDDQDACPDEAGVAPEGCPVGDEDGDGFLDDVDACVSEPETQNGFEDDDGCPDELPEELQSFTGSIKGITFDTNKATIRRSSIPTLDKAVRILGNHPSIRIEVAGHTDSKGAHDHNMDLSRERAESVKSYLVGMGIAEDRIVTKGYGPDVPIDTNETKAGRANNRRIEFRILTGAE
jgi:OOP family OmpA-OmpF porin